MYLSFTHRHNVLKHLKNMQTICEVGVLKGDNAAFLYEALRPQSMHLIDFWSSERAEEQYYVTDTRLSFMRDMEGAAEYYGGSPREQDTYDRLFRGVVDRFEGCNNVHIHRKESHLAAADYPDEYFDMVYLDANHQYPYIQRDLFAWANKVKKNGFLILNDCSSSADGREQNLGVLEASVNFIKATNYRPLVLTHHTYADLVLTREENSVNSLYLKTGLLTDENIYTIEVPGEFLASYHHRYLRYDDNGVAKVRIMPSFKWGTPDGIPFY
jgi:hypothetical protein